MRDFESGPNAGGMKRQLLSARESEVLEWLKAGKSSWEISVLLEISETTVNYHVKNILRKLDVANRYQAVSEAHRLGLIGGE